MSIKGHMQDRPGGFENSQSQAIIMQTIPWRFSRGHRLLIRSITTLYEQELGCFCMLWKRHIQRRKVRISLLSRDYTCFTFRKGECI